MDTILPARPGRRTVCDGVLNLIYVASVCRQLTKVNCELWHTISDIRAAVDTTDTRKESNSIRMNVLGSMNCSSQM